MNKYPSIAQFRNVIKEVTDRTHYAGRDANGNAIYDSTRRKPVIKMTGTVKLHGSNGGIGVDANGNYWAQSRENILSLTQDNAGFNVFVQQLKPLLEPILENIRKEHNADRAIVFGEWCGGSIQKGVALNQLNKMFVAFDVCVYFDSEVDANGTAVRHYVNQHICEFAINEANIYNIYMFPIFKLDIDFQDPQLAQNKLVEITNQVEAECPVGKYFGVSGIGEGVVWTGIHTTELGDIPIMFKVKGERHSSSKVKTLAEIDPVKLENTNKFVEYAVTENRLEQGFTYLKENNIEISVKSTGAFLKWVMGDIVKEESDVLIENGLSVKDISSKASNAARTWFMAQLDKEAFGG